MASGTSHDGSPITAINVTPLVDVCLVLVIIFMAVAPMAVSLGLQVLETRPSNAEGKASADENVSIRLKSDGSVAVNGRRTDGFTFRRELIAALAHSKDRLVIISADAGNKVGMIVDVLDQSRQAGAAKLALMKAGG